ncbi:MAG: hypothetical protein HYR71_09860 [Chloroflexi bacterium]|nr:hypothetical protein [Chloroflexota bacterium]
MQIVDTQSASEFMREVMQQTSPADLDAMEHAVGRKSRSFQQSLARETLTTLSPEALKELLRQVFSARRRVPSICEHHSHEELLRLIGDLLYGNDALAPRFDRFCAELKGVDEPLGYDLAGELLHYTLPDQYWLWTRWMWDPQNQTGALRLVTSEELELQAGSPGEMYLKVGEAVAFINATGEAAGFTRMGDRRFGVDVFLACVYGIYTYTVLRMRMTQEFNKVMPQLPELARRLLGVWERFGTSRRESAGGRDAG